MYLIKSQFSELLKDRYSARIFRPGDDCMPFCLNQSNHLVNALLDALVSLCNKGVAAASSNFLALLRFRIEDNYIAATHYSNLDVIYWSYCRIKTWSSEIG